jgi:hypothetical protein
MLYYILLVAFSHSFLWLSAPPFFLQVAHVEVLISNTTCIDLVGNYL